MAFRRFVVAKLYCDERFAEDAEEIKAFNLALERRLANNNKQPAYVVLDPETEEVFWNSPFRNAFRGTDAGDNFARQLDGALRRFNARRKQ